jgi:hypothetical protein
VAAFRAAAFRAGAFRAAVFPATLFLGDGMGRSFGCWIADACCGEVRTIPRSGLRRHPARPRSRARGPAPDTSAHLNPPLGARGSQPSEARTPPPAQRPRRRLAALAGPAETRARAPFGR